MCKAGGGGFDLLFGGNDTDEIWGVLPDFGLGETLHQQSSSGLDCDCQIEVCTGRICVHKFNDLNGDGIQNNGEPGLQSWVFQLSAKCVGGTLVTDANGNACGDFFAGTYTISEQPQTGWTATTPTSLTVTITAGQATNVRFGNRRVM